MGWIADLLKEIPSAARYKSELEAMEKENTRLRKEIEERDNIIQKEKSHNNLLDENKIKLLIFLSTQQDRLTAEEIAQSLNLNLQVIKFSLEEPEKQKMVYADLYSDGSPPEWLIIHDGRKYLIKNKLII